MNNNLLKYNSSYIPYIFTLENNSVFCYLNSLVQSLMSCSSFNEYLVENNNGKNPVITEYLTIYKRYLSETKTIEVDDAHSIVKSLNLDIHSQQDIHECLMLLLDFIGGDVNNLFNTRYKCELHCLNCKYTFSMDNQPSELLIDLSEENLTTKISIENHIKINKQIPRDYCCEKCNIKNTYNPKTKEVSENIIQVYKLVRLSSIIVLLFKKYNVKNNIYFPLTLDFMSINGKLKYKVVSQMEHSGNTSGGHYIAKCLRKKPFKFHENRKKRAELILINIERKINSTNLSKTEKIDYDNRIQKVKTTLNLDEEIKDKKDSVFLFNDSNVKYSPEGFEPTKNTYMVFYHLFE